MTPETYYLTDSFIGRNVNYLMILRFKQFCKPNSDVDQAITVGLVSAELGFEEQNKRTHARWGFRANVEIWSLK